MGQVKQLLLTRKLKLGQKQQKKRQIQDKTLTIPEKPIFGALDCFPSYFLPSPTRLVTVRLTTRTTFASKTAGRIMRRTGGKNV